MGIFLRKVLKKDWDFILKLRNEDSFSTLFENKKKITKKEHHKYLTKQKSNPHFFNWIISFNNKHVGYVRILDNDIGIIIDPKFQSKSIGTTTIKLLEEEAKNHNIKKLVGRVMIHNKNSKKIFVRNNFQLKMYWYEKEILPSSKI